MKSVILYSKETADLRYQAITLPGGKHLFIRAEVVEADPLFALDRATPQEGEIVLNTIPYPGENAQPMHPPMKNSESNKDACIRFVRRPNAAGWWYDTKTERWRWCFDDPGMGFCARESKSGAGHFWLVSNYKPANNRWCGPWSLPNA